MEYPITPDNQEAVALVKAINHWVRRQRPFAGGMAFGVDYNTWRAVFPQISAAYQKAAEIIAGRSGRFMPRFN